jgi:predicted dehydrogenase
MIGVAVVGCGLIGERRAATAAGHPATRLVMVVDPVAERGETVAAKTGATARTPGPAVAVVADWREALGHPDVAVVVVATPNGYLAEIGVAALEAGRHVLLEKPMGRGVEEARRLAAAASSSGRQLKVGFNHRYHPGLERARALVADGAVGRVINLRARYGHGSRPGCETEWRADPELAGGGELMDQGVHVVDLFHWFAGLPAEAMAFTQTAVWRIDPLEDNAFGLFRWSDGVVAQLHVSMTQWKNHFSFEVFGELGSVAVEGLGGSYGMERLVRTRRRMEGGVPEVDEEVFPGPDGSWAAEWEDLVAAIETGRPPRYGSPADGVAAMRMVDALYRSARTGSVARVV